MMTRILTTASAAILALSVTAVAGENKARWQTNDDGGVSQESFATTIDEAGTFGRLDADGSGDLSEDEFSAWNMENTGAYAEWDSNTDGAVSQDEFNSGLYATADADDDDYVSSDELSSMNTDMLFEGTTGETEGEGTNN